MSREEPQINVRVSEELKAKIKSRAMSNRRSMNAEIVHILQEAVDESSRGIDELAQREADKFKEALLETLKNMQDNKKPT